MCSPSPPSPPDYVGAAQAQGGANLEAAQATSRLSNPNVVSPFGTQTYTEGAGPSDRPTLNQTFSPEQQALYEQSLKTKGLLGELGTQGATALQGVVGKNLDLSGAPATPGSSEETRNKVINSMMSRVDTDTANRRDQVNSDLIAAGIRPGTKAYSAQMDQVDRSYNDARQQAITASGAEASRDFGLDTQRRKDAIAEMLAQRQTPLNEINAIMSGSQVTNPFATPAYSGAQVAPAPVAGATNQIGQWNTDMYNQQVGAQNAQTQAGGSAAAAYMMYLASL